MGNPNCCFMIIAVTFFFSSQSPRGTVLGKKKLEVQFLGPESLGWAAPKNYYLYSARLWVLGFVLLKPFLPSSEFKLCT
jgi:hypothetical protein